MSWWANWWVRAKASTGLMLLTIGVPMSVMIGVYVLDKTGMLDDIERLDSDVSDRIGELGEP